ncbi:MAG: 50S ribosomal protein L32e [Thermoplasmata archaeon]
MADDAPAPVATKESAPARRPRKKAVPSSDAPAPKAAEAPKTEEIRIPRRADLSAPLRTLLGVRRSLDRRRPIFGRQAANRYYRIGRDGSWRRPRGLQSKQRRHYGYRAQIVSIGYRSPARVRGLVPSGFAPVIVHTTAELEGIDARRQAAIIARTVGTRRRLVLEEEARKLGIRVLNPIIKPNAEA